MAWKSIVPTTLDIAGSPANSDLRYARSVGFGPSASSSASGSDGGSVS